MSNLSFRPRGSDGPLYSPSRDWAYNYPQMVTCIAKAFNSDFWPEIINVVAAAEQCSETEAWEELVAANEAYARYYRMCTEDSTETMEAVLKRCGWEDISPAAQCGYLAMLGQVMTGQAFLGLRDVTPEGGVSEMVQQLERLMQSGFEGRRVMNNMTKGEDLTVDLATLVRLLRNEQVPWSVIKRIIRREMKSEGALWPRLKLAI